MPNPTTFTPPLGSAPRSLFSADFGFLKKVRDFLPRHFPKAGRRSVKRCRAFIWELPRRQAA